MKKGVMGILTVLAMTLSVAWAEPGDPATTPATPAPAPATATPTPAPAKPVERVAPPKPVERVAPAKPVERAASARPVPEPVKSAKPATEPATEKPEAASPAPPANATTEACTDGLACWLIGFAMLVVGFAAGFIARHLVSRRQLGGMTVRIGTWRGIP